MERFPKIKFIVLTIVIITLINVIALAIILRYTFNEHKSDGIKDKKEIVHRGFDYLKEQLKLTPEQEILFKNERDSFFASANLYFDQLEAKRLEVIKELSVPNPDTVALYKISDEMGQIHASLKRQVIDHILRLRKYCNPEQLVKLDSMYNVMIRTDSPWRNKHKQKEGSRDEQSKRN